MIIDSLKVNIVYASTNVPKKKVVIQEVFSLRSLRNRTSINYYIIK